MSADADLADKYLPHVLPIEWSMIPDMLGAYRRSDRLQVLCSISREADGALWLHVSCSRRDKIPSWKDMTDVKALFIGDARMAYQVFPRAAEYVNIHQWCMHLWSPLEGPDRTPDFRKGGLI